MHYNKFPNLGVYRATFPNLKGPKALPKIAKIKSLVVYLRLLYISDKYQTLMGQPIKFWLWTISISFVPENLSPAATQKEDQKLVFKTNYRLMQVKSIAECSKRSFCITFDPH